jgi:hypothetical protein
MKSKTRENLLDEPEIEKLKKSSSESGDPQLRNAVNILVEKFTKYKPILEELDQVRNIVAQKQAQISQGAACEAPAPTGPASQIPAIIEFIRPYITPPDPFRELMMTVVKENIDLSRAIKNAVVSKLTGIGAPEATAP